MTYDPRKVVTAGFPMDDARFTYAINDAGASNATLGYAVELDTSAPGTVKLALEGAAIFGQLISYEDRSGQAGGITGTVARQFKDKLPAAVGHGIAIGDAVCGHGGGLVRKSVVGTDPVGNIVVETGVDFVVVEKL